MWNDLRINRLCIYVGDTEAEKNNFLKQEACVDAFFMSSTMMGNGQEQMHKRQGWKDKKVHIRHTH